MKFKKGDIVKISKTSKHYGQTFAIGKIIGIDFDRSAGKNICDVLFTTLYENVYWENELELVKKKTPITEKDLIL